MQVAVVVVVDENMEKLLDRGEAGADADVAELQTELGTSMFPVLVVVDGM